MISFTHNDWGQREILNNIIILTKRVADTIYTIIPTKYQNYPSTTTLKHANVLSKVNKLPYKCLLNTNPRDSYSLTIHMCKMTLADISHKQKEQNTILKWTKH